MRYYSSVSIVTLSLMLPASMASPLWAQQDDRGYLQALLEDNLSGEGRKVSITGFAGALSSRATIQKLTIADDKGIWLSVDDVVLDWSRTALLSGTVIINEFSASHINLDRLPEGKKTSPKPEARSFDFTLPELPVSIDIGGISAPRITLGESILGHPLEASIEANLHLAEGQGNGTLTLLRTDDGPDGKLALSAGFVNETRILSLDLDLREEAGGLAATALELPGLPETEVTLLGQGTIESFAANFRFATDGQDRLAGPITVTKGENGATGFTASLKGDPAPLFLPEYSEFLGNSLGMAVTGEAWPNGRLQISGLTLEARSLNLVGSLDLAADGLPDRINLTGFIKDPNNNPVLLPIAGQTPTRINRADLSLKFDSSRNSAWNALLLIEGLDRADVAAQQAQLIGQGTIERLDEMRGANGAFDIDLTGLSRLDPAILDSFGDAIKGRIGFDWRKGAGALELPQVSISGIDYTLNGALTLNGLESDLTVSGAARLESPNLGRFSAIAGRPLGGAAKIDLSGSYAALTGAFDAAVDLAGQGLRTGIPEADRLLAGSSSIQASVLRDENGMTLRSFEAAAASLKVSAAGKLATKGSDLTGRVDWGNLADLGGPYAGAISTEVSASGTLDNGSLRLSGFGEGLKIGQPEVDRLIAGRSEITAEASVTDGQFLLNGLQLNGRNISASVAQESDQVLRVSGRLNDLALLAPQFPGPVTLAGTVNPFGSTISTDLQMQGPGGINLRLNGNLTDNLPDLTLAGTADAALANAFSAPLTLAGPLRYDLKLQGGWSPANLSGRITLNNGRVAVPARGLSLENMAVTADLAQSTLRLAASANTTGGGRLTLEGPLSTNAPYTANLALRIAALKLRDPELYETTLNGALALAGPLLGNARLSGLIEVSETELRIPSTGFTSGADLEAFLHKNDTSPVRATRARAGIGKSSAKSSDAAGGGLPNWALDLTITAPNRIYLRGRGLDAELSGSLKIGGTLNQIQPSGGIQLVRGRLDILGKRLNLEEATIALEGNFTPWLTVRASNVAGDVTSFVTIDGPADNPVVSFTSDPELPQEEVLALLLFGRNLDSISPFQAAQLAGAVATLAGKGGGGILGKLRQGFGFDDFDVSTEADGSTSVKVGKYISENVYTELGVDGAGNTRINLNYDIKPGLTVKSRMDADGSSGIGIYREKDY